MLRVLILTLLLFGSGVTAHPERPALRLGFVTDAQESGDREGLRRALAALDAWGAEWLLYGGDTSYEYGPPPDDWTRALGPYEDRTLFVYGNHDASGYDRYQPGNANATWWAWERNGAVVIGIDTSARLQVGSPQYEWLSATLAAHEDDVVILMMHVAWWVPNVHHDARYAVQGNATQLDALVHEHAVDLVLAGHEHYYARMTRDGVPFVVVGAVEATTRPVPSRVAAEADHASSNRTWLRIEVGPCGISMWADNAEAGVEDTLAATCPEPRPQPGQVELAPAAPEDSPQESHEAPRAPPERTWLPYAAAALAASLMPLAWRLQRRGP